ncbi:soluble NSF attachment protein, partial [Hyaloraphidium curvatum]
AGAWKQAKSFEEAAETYIKAAECYRQLDSMFMAAKATENAASIYVNNLKLPAKASAAYKITSEYYAANGTPDKAADALEKAAKQVEGTSFDTAIGYYQEACELLETEDKGRFATDVYRRAISLLLKNGRLPEAAEFMGRLGGNLRGLGNRTQLHKTALGLVVVRLAMGDEIGAQKAINDGDGFSNSEEGAAANDLLAALTTADADKLQSVLSRHVVSYLGNEVTRLSRTLKVPEGRTAPPAAPAPSADELQRATGAITDLQDEIEEEGIM